MNEFPCLPPFRLKCCQISMLLTNCPLKPSGTMWILITAGQCTASSHIPAAHYKFLYFLNFPQTHFYWYPYITKKLEELIRISVYKCHFQQYNNNKIYLVQWLAVSHSEGRSRPREELGLKALLRVCGCECIFIQSAACVISLSQHDMTLRHRGDYKLL